jgi:hypothetical protein
MVDATRWFGACGYAYLRWIAAHHGAPDIVRTLVPRDTEMQIGTRQRPADLAATLFRHTQQRRVVAVLVGRLRTEIVLKKAHGTWAAITIGGILCGAAIF